MERFACNKCGKFIAEKDIPNCESEDLWSWDKIELICVVYLCLKCTAKLKKEKAI